MSTWAFGARPRRGFRRGRARLAPVIALWLICGNSTGCASNLRLTLLAAAAGPQRDVALYIDVADAQGQPVLDLASSNFRIYEDGQLVSSAEAQQTLADRELAAQHFTLLLIERSSSGVMSDQVGLIRASEVWLAQIQPDQRVAVYAFDGGKTLRPILPFQREQRDPRQALASLQSMEARDPATNLHGAVLSGLAELGRAIRGSHAPLRYGTLVVLTDGVDRANRISQRQMLDAVEAAPYRVFTLGVGRELDDSVLSRLGKTGYIRVEESSAVATAFRELAELITRASHRQYLLRYCSPARGGHHHLSVEVDAPAGRGQLDYQLDASKLQTPCDLTRAPLLAPSSQR